MLVINNETEAIELTDDVFGRVYRILLEPMSKEMGDEWRWDFEASAEAYNMLYLDDLSQNAFDRAYREINQSYTKDESLAAYKDKLEKSFTSDPRFKELV